MYLTSGKMFAAMVNSQIKPFILVVHAYAGADSESLGSRDPLQKYIREAKE